MKISLGTLIKDMQDIQHDCLDKVQGRILVNTYLSSHPLKEPHAIIAIGKAACSMAEGALMHYPESSKQCLIITKEKHTPEAFSKGYPDAIIIESGHPIPNEASIQAGEALAEFCQKLEDTPVLCLISGGGSSLVELPKPGFSLADIQNINKTLISKGSSINLINNQRKKYSRIKDGGLAHMLAKNRILALYLSDVPNNDTASIASGLLENPLHPHQALKQEILADNYTICLFAAAAAAKKNYRVRCHAFFHEDSVEATAKNIAEELRNVPDCLHIWGGEPSMKLPSTAGRGGRNQHLTLLLADEIQGKKPACFSSIGTDGTDGNTENTGGLVTNQSMEQIRRNQLSFEQAIKNADSASVLEKIGAELRTGPTGTNLMDLILGYA